MNYIPIKYTLAKVALVLFTIFYISENCFAQNTEQKNDTTKMYKIDMRDGSTFYGNIIKRDAETITFKTTAIPRMDISLSSIQKIELLDKTNYKEGKYFFPNPHATRYLYGPSGYSLKRGEGYYQNTYLLLNSFNVGITNNISIGAGIELVSTMSALTTNYSRPIFFITPKIGFEVTKNFNAGGGVLYASIPYMNSGDRGSIGIAYGIATLGSKDHNITGGLGWGFINQAFSQRPIITISGLTRISKGSALVTENWLIPANGSYNGIFSYGVRFFGPKMAVDLAFLNNPSIANAIVIGIPYVSFTIKF